MKLKKLILENFRGYTNRTVIDFDDFTALIGRNDAGKSTILEALSIFFEETKPDSGDASVHGNSQEVRIGVAFTHLPAELDLDRGARSTLEAEYLLNIAGELEIHKIYNLSVSRVGPPKILAVANHPSADQAKGLILLTNTDLKKRVREQNLIDNANLNENPSMRRALYDAAGDLELQQQEVLLTDANGKEVWKALQLAMPMFALFKSDRASSDQDPEVQNPMKSAIQTALSELQEELAAVTAEVKIRAEETAARTLDQLQKSYPDLASTLTPVFRAPSWQNLFKVDLESDDGVPLNKRGSGIRRLVLMSFFQAEAEKKREELGDAAPDTRRPVIYAVEEPETSQHPDTQEKIVSTLLELSSLGDQVIVTTHVPGLAGLMPAESLRFIEKSDLQNAPQIKHGSPEVFRLIADTLGVLPDAIESNFVKVAVLVEGKTDIDALISIATVLSDAGHIAPLDLDKIFWAIGGGQTLKDWVERDYLGQLNLPQVVIFDSDRTSEALPMQPEKQDRIRNINAWANRDAFATQKREIENYVDLDELNLLADDKLVYPDHLNPDYSDLPRLLPTVFRDAIDNRGLVFHATDSEGNNIPVTNRNFKKVIASYVFRNMPADKLLERSRYTKDDEDLHEVLDWLNAIQKHCD